MKKKSTKKMRAAKLNSINQLFEDIDKLVKDLGTPVHTINPALNNVKVLKKSDLQEGTKQNGVEKTAAVFASVLSPVAAGVADLFGGAPILGSLKNAVTVENSELATTETNKKSRKLTGRVAKVSVGDLKNDTLVNITGWLKNDFGPWLQNILLPGAKNDPKTH